MNKDKLLDDCIFIWIELINKIYNKCKQNKLIERNWELKVEKIFYEYRYHDNIIDKILYKFSITDEKIMISLPNAENNYNDSIIWYKFIKEDIKYKMKLLAFIDDFIHKYSFLEGVLDFWNYKKITYFITNMDFSELEHKKEEYDENIDNSIKISSIENYDDYDNKNVNCSERYNKMELFFLRKKKKIINYDWNEELLLIGWALILLSIINEQSEKYKDENDLYQDSSISSDWENSNTDEDDNYNLEEYNYLDNSNNETENDYSNSFNDNSSSSSSSSD